MGMEKTVWMAGDRDGGDGERDGGRRGIEVMAGMAGIMRDGGGWLG